MPNCVAKPKGEKRSYIADEINQVKDISSLNLRRPVDRGYVVNWDLQRDILDHVFKKVLKINPKNCIGTVLSLNGHRRYFCMYHAKHPEATRRPGYYTARQVEEK